jgi:hypothetical protein
MVFLGHSFFLTQAFLSRASIFCEACNFTSKRAAASEAKRGEAPTLSEPQRGEACNFTS